jgi:hypothetical protein
MAGPQRFHKPYITAHRPRFRVPESIADAFRITFRTLEAHCRTEYKILWPSAPEWLPIRESGPVKNRFEVQTRIDSDTYVAMWPLGKKCVHPLILCDATINLCIAT